MKISPVFVLALALPTSVAAADWPQFLGPQRNGVTPEPASTGITWPKDGPEKLWSVQVGEGFSGPIVQDGRVYTFHRLDDEEVLDCYSISDGERQWRAAYPCSYRDRFGNGDGPRATPAIDSNTLYTFGAAGRLTAFDATTGNQQWSVDLAGKFDAPTGFFGFACSPLVTEHLVLLNIGGEPNAGIVAVDRANGKVAWTATDHEAGYSSPVLARWNGKYRALFLTRNGFVSLDPEDGKILHQFPLRAPMHASVNAASPLVLDENKVFVSASYDTGAAVLDLSRDKPKEVWSGDGILSNHYSTSVAFEDHLYGFHGRVDFHPGATLRCVSTPDGKVAWESEPLGSGSLIRRGEELIVLLETGQLLLVDASPAAFKILARAQILGSGARAYPAFADGNLYARDGRQMARFRLAP